MKTLQIINLYVGAFSALISNLILPKQKQKPFERVGKRGTASHRMQPVTAVDEISRAYDVLDAAMRKIFASLEPSRAHSE